MLKNKKIIGFFWSIIILALPLVTLAQYVTPVTTGLPTTYDLEDVILNVMDWMLAIFGFLGIIGFVVAGIIYLTSAGDDTRMKTAKGAMTYSIIGVIVGLLGYVIIQAVDSALNGIPMFYFNYFY